MVLTSTGTSLPTGFRDDVTDDIYLAFQVNCHYESNPRAKVAMITGGASGIGKACAKRFAEEGA